VSDIKLFILIGGGAALITEEANLCLNDFVKLFLTIIGLKCFAKEQIKAQIKVSYI
jgi:hypothetical protein